MYLDVNGPRGPVHVKNEMQKSSKDDATAERLGASMLQKLDSPVENLFDQWKASGVKCDGNVRWREARMLFTYKPNRSGQESYWNLEVDEGFLTGRHKVTTCNLVHLLVATFGTNPYIRLGENAEEFAGQKREKLKELFANEDAEES